MWEFFRRRWKGWGKAGRWRSRDKGPRQTNNDVRYESWNLQVVEDKVSIRYSGLLLKDGHTLWWRKVMEENGRTSAETKKAWWREARKERSFDAKEPERGPEKRGGTAMTWWRKNPDMPFAESKEEVAPRCETGPGKRAEKKGSVGERRMANRLLQYAGRKPLPERRSARRKKGKERAG